RFTPDPEQRRAITRNALAVEAMPGVPAALRQLERTVADAFATTAYLLDECLWVAPSALGMVHSVVGEQWREGPGRAGLPVCDLGAVDAARREILSCGLHPALFDAPATFAAGAAAVP